MSQLDLHILPSKSESFPNVVAETMACGIPNIATDVGDAGLIIGKTGWLVQPENSYNLATAIEKAIKQLGTNSWKIKSNQARMRIKKNFNLNLMIKKYNKVWNEIYK